MPDIDKLETLSVEDLKKEFPISRIRNDFFEHLKGQLDDTIYDEEGENPKEISISTTDEITLLQIKIRNQVYAGHEMIELELLIGIGKFVPSTTGIFKVEKTLGSMRYNADVELIGIDLFYDTLYQLK